MTQLPNDWKSIVLAKMYTPNGVWEDFNFDLQKWQEAKERLVDTGLISILDFPAKPIIADYSDDLTTDRTRP